MQAIIFIGLQASGKSTYYKEHFFNTHLRISMDLLNTRNKEKQFLEKAIELQQAVVIDNTNPQKLDRQRYIPLFQKRKYKIHGYYFKSNVNDCLLRNNLRSGKEKIPKIGLLSTQKQMQAPIFEEGFDRLFEVDMQKNEFIIKEISNEI